MSTLCLDCWRAKTKKTAGKMRQDQKYLVIQRHKVSIIDAATSQYGINKQLNNSSKPRGATNNEGWHEKAGSGVEEYVSSLFS
jgi:hypothetical protein